MFTVTVLLQYILTYDAVVLHTPAHKNEDQLIDLTNVNLPSLISPKFPQPIFLSTRKLGPTINMLLPLLTVEIPPGVPEGMLLQVCSRCLDVYAALYYQLERLPLSEKLCTINTKW